MSLKCYAVMYDNLPVYAMFTEKKAREWINNAAKNDKWDKKKASIQSIYIDDIGWDLLGKIRKNRGLSHFFSSETEIYSPIGKVISALSNLYPLELYTELVEFLQGNTTISFKKDGETMRLTYTEIKEKYGS